MSTDPKVQKLIDKAVKAERARVTAAIKDAAAKIAADEAYCKNGKKGSAAMSKAALAAVKAPAAEPA